VIGRLVLERIPSLIARAGVKEIGPVSESGVVQLPIGGSLLRVVVPFTTSNPAAKCQGIFKFIRLLDGRIKLFTTTTQLLEVSAAPWKDPRNPHPVSNELPKKVDILVVGGG